MNSRFFVVAASLLFAGSNAWAHPFHSSTTEIEWNASSGKFEVAMRLRIADLEDALSAIEKRRVNVETDPDRERFVKAYLQKHFSIGHRKDEKCLLHWVGMELELHDAWVYFEAEVAGKPSQPANQQTADTPKLVEPATATVKSWDELFRRRDLSSTAGDRDTKAAPPIHVRCSVLLDLQPEQENVVTVTVDSDTETALLNGKVRTAVLFPRK
ncbi:DUF6702 family protein [Fuerstiella marisgermanici]|uniref:Uncharacterized protein n=1 Tax=Fuerstiella marisgermanici TaxID=1891926 RepID=A0A1P8WDN2_9PLAN|nr:DUF6702 family protein [Fuerstiella marisgermanici]APZ92182.1 hypothetical protein Fuma_01791 [Fuerstiella marisgermanici]